MVLNININKLKKKIKKKNGKNFRGLITFKHRGGGHKRKFKLIDNKYYIFNIPMIIIDIIYNSHKNLEIGLVYYSNNILSYINISNINKKGDILIISNISSLNEGNISSLKNINVGLYISNIELYLGHGSQINKSGNTFSLIISKFKKYNKTLLKLKSTEEYLLNNNCFAQIGINRNKYRIKLKKAGQNRWLNRRPVTRGVAKNPVDHPHGGGEGKTSGGRCSVTPFGKLTKGKKTRKKFINNNIIFKRKNKNV